MAPSSSRSTEETELLPLSSSSSSGISRGSALPPPLPTPPSPASFFKTMKKMAAEAAAAAAVLSSGSRRDKGLPTSSASPQRRRGGTGGGRHQREGQRRQRLLATTAAAALLLLLSLVLFFSFEVVLTAKEGKGEREQQQKAAAFGQRTAELVHAKTLRPAAEAAAVASLRMRAVAAAAASRASASLSATATALSEGTSAEAEEDAPVASEAAAAAETAAAAEAQATAAAAQAQAQATAAAAQAQAQATAAAAQAQAQAAALHEALQAQAQSKKPRFSISTQPLTAFVGVQSRPVTRRRQTLRDTWFPSTPEERERLLAPFQSPTTPSLRHGGIAFRFVVGSSAVPAENALVEEEARAHGDLLVLEGVRENYGNLILKTVAFFSAAVEAFPGAAFIVKIDDDVYVRPDNLALVAAQWEAAGRDYVGCLMKGGQAFNDKRSVYYEPLNALLPDGKYYGYMSGSAYALSRRAALLLRSRTTKSGEEGAGESLGGEEAESIGGGSGSSGSGGNGSSSSNILSGPLGGLRPMACEDCAVGLWLLAHDVRHGEDLRMCRYDYEIEVEEVEGETAAGGGEPATAETAEKKKTRKRHSCARPGRPLEAPVVVTNKCNGLCDPEASLVNLHGDPACRAPTLGAEGAAAAGGGAGPSSSSSAAAASAVPALPLGDFWASNRDLSRADAVSLECIRVTAEGNVDKSACKEEKGKGGGGAGGG